jgi:hypothetical protein
VGVTIDTNGCVANEGSGFFTGSFFFLPMFQIICLIISNMMSLDRRGRRIIYDVSFSYVVAAVVARILDVSQVLVL